MTTASDRRTQKRLQRTRLGDSCHPSSGRGAPLSGVSAVAASTVAALAFILLLFAGSPSLVPYACAGDVSGYRGVGSISSRLSAPTGVATDFRKRIIVTETPANRLVVFSPGGGLVKEKGGLAKPTGVAAAPDGRIFVGNAGRGSVDVLDGNLVFLYRLGRGDGEFTLPLGIAVDDLGIAYVVDGKEDRVKVYDGVGAFLFSFGGSGDGDGRFRFPTAVACNEVSREIVVTDLPTTSRGSLGARVQIFGHDGMFKRRFASFGIGEGLLVKPMGVAVDGTGRIFVADAYQNAVQVFDGSGTFLFAIHDKAYPLRTPMGIALEPRSGKLYVASLNTSRVVVYDSGHGRGDAGGERERTSFTFVSGGGSCSVGGASPSGAPSYGAMVHLLLPFLWLLRRRRRAAPGGGSPCGGGEARPPMPPVRGKTNAGRLPCLFVMVVLSCSPAVSDAASSSSFPLQRLAPMSGVVLYPHIDPQERMTCESCHDLKDANPYLLPAWAVQEPVDMDDTLFNNLCRHCHNDITAPFARTHSCLTTSLKYGSWTLECTTCHNQHRQEQPYVYGDAAHLVEGTVLSVTDNALTATSGGWADNQHRGLLLVPNIREPFFSFRIERNNGNTLYPSSPMVLGRVSPGDTFAIVYGKLIRSAITTPSGETRQVRLFRGSGANSLADGDGAYDGVCEVCHTKTACFRCSGEGSGTHRAGERCTQCHTHGTGFRNAGGGAHRRHLPLLSCGSGSQGCHGTYAPPLLGDGQNIANTTVCGNCHSPGGVYDGVNDPVVGAKANWNNGVYEGGDLAAGKGKWCATCHDESPSVIGGVSAPNVVGDEDGNYGYGTGWGYYKTGHGLSSGVYPSSQEPAANLTCTACHDPDAPHIDNNYRTYSAYGDNYQAGYRLKQAMDVPRTDQGEPVSDFALCLGCHASSQFLVSTDTTTNFRDDTSANSHWMHLQAPPTGMWAGGGWWDSDWNGTGDSKISCPACHNVHGSPSPRMLRHGELTSTPGTTDKVPSINFRYTPYLPTPYPTFANSTGGQLNPTSPGGGTVANTGICSMCHSNVIAYSRTPTDRPPRIKGVYAETGGSVLAVVFTEGVYTTTGASGALVAGDFSYADADNGRTVTGVTHTAGGETAYLTLSFPLDSSNDIGIDTLAAATTASIYDNASQAMGTVPVAVSGDVAPPSVADRSPASGATDVGIQSNVALSLLDGESGVDWTTFSITLSGNLGYSATYTDLDSSVVSRTGSPSGYAVTVNPVTNFSYGETITVTVNMADLVGNTMTSSVWTFTTVSGGAPLTLTLHPADNVYSGIFNPVPAGSTWTAALAANDGDSVIVQSGTGSGYPINTTSCFIVNMENPSGIGGATIQDFTVHVLARYVTAGGTPPPAAGTMQVCYTTNGVENVCTGDFSLPAVASYGDYATVTATTDSAGGALDLTDIDNLRVEVRRRSSGGVWLRVTEVNAAVTYLP